MRYLFLILPFVMACESAEIHQDEQKESTADIISNVEPDFFERGVTYEGAPYHISSQKTMVLDTHFYMSTIIELSPKKSPNLHYPAGVVSIELKYPLEEGEYDCSAIRQPQYEEHGEIIFIETIGGVTKRYTSIADFNPKDSVGAPGGYIKVFDKTEDNWSLEFGGGGNLPLLEDQVDWGRCGTGTILNVKMN